MNGAPSHKHRDRVKEGKCWGGGGGLKSSLGHVESEVLVGLETVKYPLCALLEIWDWS